MITREEYQQMIAQTVKVGEKRNLADGREVYFDENTGFLVLYNPDSPGGGTAFVPHSDMYLPQPRWHTPREYFDLITDENSH